MTSVFPDDPAAESTEPHTVAISLRISGAARAMELDPRTTLLDALREYLHLTGVKKGCDHGQCGACTVLVNGRRIIVPGTRRHARIRRYRDDRRTRLTRRLASSAIALITLIMAFAVVQFLVSEWLERRLLRLRYV